MPKSDRHSADRKLLEQFLDELEAEPSQTVTESPTTTIRDKLLRVPRLVIHTPEKTWEVRLQGQASWSIGREAKSDIVITHQKVSRTHARVEIQGEDFIIRDLGSGNGTFLDQKRIKFHILQHADTINIGHAQLIFKDTRKAYQPQVTLSDKTEMASVIVVPGTLGSTLWRGSEKIWPNVRTFITQPEKFNVSADNPIEARGIVDEVVVIPKIFQVESYSRIGNYLEQTLHYTRGQNLLEFAYDWRDDIRLAAQRLADTVAQWSTAKRLVIIAHSLGCLVSRYYIDCLGGHRQVSKLILMGGPNYGTPAAILNLLPEHLIHQQDFSNAVAQKFMQLYFSFPSWYQTISTQPTIFDQYNQPINPYEESAWLSGRKQALLKASYKFSQSLNSEASIPTTCVFGYGMKTITRLNVERDAQGKWQRVEIVHTTDGDGVIPSQSAILKGAEIHPIHQSHNQLYVDEDVLMRLKYELIGVD